MTSEKIKRMLDACYQAKRIRDLLPPLPEGVMPSYIQYLEKIQALEKQGIRVKVSDISAAMSLPRPGVTRTVKEMEKKGYLKKLASPDDGRVTYISVTEAGKSSFPGNMTSSIWYTFPGAFRYFRGRSRLYD